MADLIIQCYKDTGGNGNYSVRGNYLGKATISTLSSTSQIVALPEGTRICKLVTDAVVTVYYRFGDASATAVTTDAELNAAQGEYIADVGVPNGVFNSLYIAARIA